MAYVESLPNCCGIIEIGNIRDDHDPERSVWDYATYFREENRGAFAVFSQPAPARTAAKLRGYITRHKLGKVVKVGAAKNPEHDGPLHMWVWTPNKDALKKWYNQRKDRLGNGDSFGVRDVYHNPWAPEYRW